MDLTIIVCGIWSLIKKTLLLYNQSNIMSAISTLVGEELGEESKEWIGAVAGVNGSIYGIPYCASRVMKFNPLDKSITEIGPDFGNGYKWWRGAMANNGVIYSAPYNSHRGILKIDTNTDNVTELDRNLLPERHDLVSCALALDGCIYFMPENGRRIMKLDPNNGDAMSSVGDDMGDDHNKYCGTVVGIDGCVYGIPTYSRPVVKYDPINDITSYVGEKAEQYFSKSEGGVLGRDGCIYAATHCGRVLKINTTSNSDSIVGRVESDHDGENGWGNGVLGIDGCIYWPPYSATHVLKYDPHSNLTSLVGDGLSYYSYKWGGACAAPDGIIYCLPFDTNRILAIDPLKEYALSLKMNMEEHPEQLGCLFHPSDDVPDDTNFDRAVTKFGQKKVLELLDECMPPADQICAVSNLYPFLIAASYNNSCVSMIYHLFRQTPSFVNCMKYERVVPYKVVLQSGKKRKQHSIS